MDKYIFPAIFEPGVNKGYCITFPDLPGCITEGDTLEEAYSMAKEALELHLYGMEEYGDTIPIATQSNKIQQTNKNSFIALIEAYMPSIRAKLDGKKRL